MQLIESKVFVETRGPVFPLVPPYGTLSLSGDCWRTAGRLGVNGILEILDPRPDPRPRARATFWSGSLCARRRCRSVSRGQK